MALKLLCNARMGSAKYAGGAWEIETTAGRFTAQTLVNAAGAWADEAARVSGIRPLDIKPYRRTVVQLAMAEKVPDDMPLVVGLDGSFYFKPDTAGRIWLSPHDETLSPACDAAPEEIDVAIAIDRFQQVVDSEIIRVEHKWAGLRSFAPDRLPIIGSDPDCPEFFWLAGQGGFGIQTAPAVAKLAASLLLDDRTPLENIAAATYAPERFLLIFVRHCSFGRIAGKLVCPVIAFIAAMALYPEPFDFMTVGSFDEVMPQISIANRLF